MNIRQFQYSADNLSYLIYGKTAALAIDGGATQDILSFVSQHDLRLKYIANTHSHADHTIGTKSLLEQSGATYLENKYLRETRTIALDHETIQVCHTPGHTTDSLTFHTGNVLITGDTLFNGTVGNCFSGDIAGFFHSIQYLMGFPDDTIVYAGHDYVKASMSFARTLEPDNPDIDLFLHKYDQNHVFSTLSDEQKINPYVRFNDPKIISILEKKGLRTGTEKERWLSLMTLE